MLAKTKEQASIDFETLKEIFSQPTLRKLVTRQTADMLVLGTLRTQIICRSNERASLRGLTLIAAVFEECAHWESKDTAVNPDMEIKRAVDPALLTTGGPLIISTPWISEGLFFEQFNKHRGRGDTKPLVTRGTTAQLNPTIDPAELAEIERDDPVAFASEYMNAWREFGPYMTREAVLACVDPGIVVRPPQPGIMYKAFGDCSTGLAGKNGDSYCCAIAHWDSEYDRAVLDCILEIMPPFDALNSVVQISHLLRQYGIARIGGDSHSKGFHQAAFARQGVTYNFEDVPRKSDLYLILMSGLTSGSVVLLDNQKLIDQLSSLQRKPLPSGGEKVDYPAGLHDDVANVTAGVLTLLNENNAGFNWGATVTRWSGERMSMAQAMTEAKAETWDGPRTPLTTKVLEHLGMQLDGPEFVKYTIA